MENLFIVLISGTLTAAAAALVGVFLSLRKMVLVSDSLPHIALPGIALGIIFSFSPIFGAFLFLAAAALTIWFVEYRTGQAVESIVGVLFVTALAAGAVLAPEEGILEAFFGNIETLTASQAIFQGFLAVLIAATVFYGFKSLVLSSIAPDLAKSLGINVSRVELLLLGLVALTVTIGINFVGVLLMSALLIVPAVSARNFAGNLKSFFVLSVVFGVVSAVLGIFLSEKFGAAPGIFIVFVAALLFVISLIFRAGR